MQMFVFTGISYSPQKTKHKLVIIQLCYIPSIFVTSVALSSDMSFHLVVLIMSCRETAAKEFNPDDIVLKYTVTDINYTYIINLPINWDFSPTNVLRVSIVFISQ